MPPPPPSGKGRLKNYRPAGTVAAALAAAAVILTACEPPAPPVTADPAEPSVTTLISGTVTGQHGTAPPTPLGGVKISALVPDQAAQTASTDAQGKYSFSVSHKGSFTFSAAKEGYGTKTAAVTAPNGGPKTQNFTLDIIETLKFRDSAVRKSKMLVSTNGDAAQSFTNPLVTATVLKPEGTPVTSGVTYSITEKPAGLTGQITVNPSTGEVGFGKPALDRVNADGPQTITVQAAYQGKTYRYTFTLTDHFSPREQHTSVVMDGDIYVIGGTTRNSSGTFPFDFIGAVQSSEVWRSSDGGLTWDQAADTRFTPRSLHGSAALNGACT